MNYILEIESLLGIKKHYPQERLDMALYDSLVADNQHKAIRYLRADGTVVVEHNNL
jgi:hypothetical protein